MQIQCLNKPQGNYVRRCWGTTPISGEVGLTARLHPLRRAAPVTSRYTRYVALHPLRRAAPDQKGCIAYGSGALPTDRVHRITLEHTTEESVAPHVSPAGRNTRNHKTRPGQPHPQQRNTGSLATPQNPRAQPTNPTPHTTRPRPVSRPRPRHSVSAAQRSATDQAVMSTWSSTAARPASRRATGTRNGEQDT